MFISIRVHIRSEYNADTISERRIQQSGIEISEPLPGSPVVKLEIREEVTN